MGSGVVLGVWAGLKSLDLPMGEPFSGWPQGLMEICY